MEKEIKITTFKEIKKLFKEKYKSEGLEIGGYNDLNKNTNMRRIKLSWAGVDNGETYGTASRNQLNKRRDEFYDFFKNELNLDCEKYTWNRLMHTLDTIIIWLPK